MSLLPHDAGENVMPDATRHENGTSLLRIEGEMTIYRALELKPLLLARLEESAALDIDLAGVTEFDTAGVQLLILACKSAQAMQRKLRLVAHSPAVAEVLELLDIAKHFDGSGAASSVCASVEPRPAEPTKASR